MLFVANIPLARKFAQYFLLVGGSNSPLLFSPRTLKLPLTLLSSSSSSNKRSRLLFLPNIGISSVGDSPSTCSSVGLSFHSRASVFSSFEELESSIIWLLQPCRTLVGLHLSFCFFFVNLSCQRLHMSWHSIDGRGKSQSYVGKLCPLCLRYQLISHGRSC